jgi:mono/diheme cytochrome c family protein
LLTGLAGCAPDAATDGYDPAMRYPLRADPIVLALPPTDPPALAPAGQLDEAVAGITRFGGKTLDPRSLPEPRRHELAAALESLFGTPAAPSAGPGANLDGLDLSPAHLAASSRVYRRLCNQCHGLIGDGRGPAGAWVYPHPRDFRTGVFKVAAGDSKPRAETLLAVIRHGVPASSMQPFDLIPEAELRAAAAYTVHLSLRGEVELRVLRALLDEETGEDRADLAAACRDELSAVFRPWQAPAGPVAEPGPPGDPRDTAYQESVRRGHRLFLGDAGCAKCHQDYGRKDAFKYSVWGTPVRVPDLTRGEFRWGKEPGELAARVRHGIPASGMPANPFLTGGEVADLVNFVREIGYPQRLPGDVREQVYPAGPR